jgi:hypothetical protein
MECTIISLTWPWSVELLPENLGNNLAHTPVISCFCLICDPPSAPASYTDQEIGKKLQRHWLVPSFTSRAGGQVVFDFGTKKKSIWHYFRLLVLPTIIWFTCALASELHQNPKDLCNPLTGWTP